jgi:hypothetical protein
MDDMESNVRTEWLLLATLVISGVVLFAGMYVGMALTSRPSGQAGTGGRQEITLRVGEEAAIGEDKIIYRGRVEGGRFLMATVIGQLDPDYAYLHTIAIEQAKHGFMLGEHKFELISAGRSKVRLWYIRNEQQMPSTGAGSGSGLSGLDVSRLGPKQIFGP